ncbi:chemotaxis protein CheW [Ferrovibrio xuzhouensis]|uniref:Chemotaxis protein CheW n=1 Tax=Ferrovibrio xuzhouensis TaxID=1576914 RepID=A0ABV7VEW7_9PROT
MSTSEYLTFAIAGQDYGAAILAVREIRGWTAETPLPNAPAGVRGIINLRGQVVPIFDLRVRLGAAATPPTATHVVIVVEAAAGQFGLLVDSVSDILTLDDAELQPVPPAATDGNGLLLALAARAERMVSLLDLDRLVSGAETQLLLEEAA